MNIKADVRYKLIMQAKKTRSKESIKREYFLRGERGRIQRRERELDLDISELFLREAREEIVVQEEKKTRKRRLICLDEYDVSSRIKRRRLESI